MVFITQAVRGMRSLRPRLPRAMYVLRSCMAAGAVDSIFDKSSIFYPQFSNILSISDHSNMNKSRADIFYFRDLLYGGTISVTLMASYIRNLKKHLE